MEIKNEVLIRVYAILFILVVAAGTIFFKAVKIQAVEGARWRSISDSLYVQQRNVAGERGSILAEDGALLATSLPFFDVHMDMKASGLTNEIFETNVDSLAVCLASLDNQYTPGGYSQWLRQHRAAGSRFIDIRKEATYSEVERIKKFPLFRLGRNKSGMIVRQKDKRQRPFGILANRTIGYVRDGAKPVGLEGFFNETLGGIPGAEMMQRVSQDVWLPIQDLARIEPKNGDDIVTTIDINLQDIAQEALLRGIQSHDADHGCAVVMEVKTGAIKAIANIGKSQEGWWETFNYAIGNASEPGSTFKLASMIALLEDEYVSLNDTIDLEGGKTKYFEETMEDSEQHNIRRTSVRHAFEISSNVGISKLIYQHYGKTGKANAFVDHLKDLNLNIPTGIELDGEANPIIKEPNSREMGWSGTTLPWMAIGYEVAITPLQIATLYNAVANNGEMMRPYLVKEVQHFGETTKSYKPTVVRRRIASTNTLSQLKELLLGVVENGTAKNLRTDTYKFAGKTGTTQINYQKIKQELSKGYQASFAGYFPAENPVYTCVVVINNPRQGGFYGAYVAGPVFREIADKAFLAQSVLQPVANANAKPNLVSSALPTFSAGNRADMSKVLDLLGMKYYPKARTEWAALKPNIDSLNMYPRPVSDENVPSVIGMGLRDALYILENRGCRVFFTGVGKVRTQSLDPGSKARGSTITLGLD
jgi:cell division protein FtsI (penicillin-binding protein 3)